MGEAVAAGWRESGVKVDGEPYIVVLDSIVTGNATMTVLPLDWVIGITTVVAMVPKVLCQ